MNNRMLLFICISILAFVPISVPSADPFFFSSVPDGIVAQSLDRTISLEIDYEDDFYSYARIVAVLNSILGQADQVEGQTEEDTIVSDDIEPFSCWQVVLCRTDGRDIPEIDIKPVISLAGPDSCYTIYFDTEEKAQEAISLYKVFDGVLYAELDKEVYAAQSDPLPSLQVGDNREFYSWGATEMGLAAYEAYVAQWGNGTSVVAVLDSGVSQHELIDAKISELGYDYVDADEDPTNDSYGHGTHVSGIIADCTYGLPVLIYPVRVLNASGGGKISNVVNAIREAIQKEVRTINLSLVARNTSDALDSAILDAVEAGITVVCAAGNANMDVSEISPSHLETEGVLVVGSADLADGGYVRSSYSNYGESVDVYSFGSNIESASNSGGYSSGSGTSYAAPHISALCGLLSLIHSDLTPSNIEQRVLKGCISYEGLTISDTKTMIPMQEGFHLRHVILGQSEKLSLPTNALPDSCCEEVQLTSADESIIQIGEDGIQAIGPGSCQVKVSCIGLEEMVFDLEVVEEPIGENMGYLKLPQYLQAIEKEAFLGNSLIRVVEVPENVSLIEERAFEDCENLRRIIFSGKNTQIEENEFSNVLLLCPEGSNALSYAQLHDLQYVQTEEVD